MPVPERIVTTRASLCFCFSVYAICWAVLTILCDFFVLFSKEGEGSLN